MTSLRGLRSVCEGADWFPSVYICWSLGWNGATVELSRLQRALPAKSLRSSAVGNTEDGGGVLHSRDEVLFTDKIEACRSVILPSPQDSQQSWRSAPRDSTAGDDIIASVCYAGCGVLG